MCNVMLKWWSKYKTTLKLWSIENTCRHGELFNHLAGQSSSVCAWTIVGGFGFFFLYPTMPCSNFEWGSQTDKLSSNCNFQPVSPTNVFNSSLLYDKLLAMPCNSYEFPLGMFTSAWQLSVRGSFYLHNAYSVLMALRGRKLLAFSW